MTIKISAPSAEGQDGILTPAALDFVATLERAFGAKRRELMSARILRQKKLGDGEMLDFLPETAEIRNNDWKVRPAPADLQDRRVEITGPVDRKMVINALNSGANCFMADFEDSNTPTWENQIKGQINLRDANTGVMSFTDPATSKHYQLKEKTAVLMARPRGFHMEERHATLDGIPLSASFFDFGFYLFHNRKRPYFYLPKLEHYQEAQLWSDVITYAEDALSLPRGTVRVTVLIETIPAAFQMDEILHTLKDHIVGLNCGRWDYIFNFIKRFQAHPSFVLPDRDAVTMTSHFLRSYSLNLIKTCHRRGAHAMGGMAAQIPVKNDEGANKRAMDKFIADKEREASDGHDGTWVAHPALVGKAREIFDRHMPGPNQIGKARGDVNITAKDLLTVPIGDITEAGLRKNINVGLLYVNAWLQGQGCVPLYNLMEDAATAEISRTQLWQWRKHGAKLKDGRVITDALMATFLDEEFAKAQVHDDAARLFRALIMEPKLEEFLTTPAYEIILGYERGAS